METQVQDVIEQELPPSKSEQQLKEEQRFRAAMLKPVGKFTKSPIKPNLTATAVAMKYHEPTKQPAVLGLIDACYSRLESARLKLAKSDLSDNQKIVKLSRIANSVYDELSKAVLNYRQDLIQQQATFEESVDNLAKPKDPVEAIQQSTWVSVLLKSENPLSTALSDSKLAAAVLQLPAALQKQIRADDNIAALKEAVFPGYLEEKARYSTLLENTDRLRSSLDSEIAPLFNSPSALVAIKQENELSNL